MWVVPLAWGSAAVAWAQTDSVPPSAPDDQAAAEVSEREKAEARRLGSEAFAALDGRDYSRAVERFTQALAHYDAPTLRLGRAQALEAQGKLLAALEDLRRAASPSTSPNEPSSFPQARVEAKTQQTQLESRIPTLTVSAPDQAEVRVDGQLWSLRRPHPVDPGVHRITVRSGGQTWTRQVELTERAREEVFFPAAEAAGAAGTGGTPAESGPMAQPAAPGPEDSSALPERPNEVEDGPNQTHGAPKASVKSEPISPAAIDAPGGSNVPLVVAATTTAVLAVAAVATGWVALGARSDYTDENRPDVSRSRKQDLRSKALAWSWANTATTAGAVLAGGITAYFWFSPPVTAAHPAEGARPWLVGVTGSF